MTTDPLDIELRDEHLEPLRRFLLYAPAGMESLDRDADDLGEAEQVLFFAAASVMVRRRFGAFFTQRQIIRFVANLRIYGDADAKRLDPRVLEEVIRVALGTVHPNDIYHSTRDPDMTVVSHLLILKKLRGEKVIPPAGIDGFMQETMAFAEQMLETQRALAAGTLTL